MLSRIVAAILFVAVPVAGGVLAGCNMPGQAAISPANADAGKTSVPPANRVPAGAGKAVGDRCHSDDPAFICLALRYVVYKDSTGAPIISEQDAASNVTSINGVWKKCNIGFEIDDYTSDNPVDHGLAYQTSTFGELDTIRNTYGDDGMLLVTTTGTWTGALGNNPANAWTAMPGGGPYGAVLERPVAKYPNIIAHEIGHYLNLLHVNDNNALMNPTIYTYSTQISPQQCATARAAAQGYWSKMVR